jgi:c-di-GMP-binding flagellar brake protein YcgR
MNARTVQKKAKAGVPAKKVVVPVDINRRREWRFEIPLTAVVEGKLPQGGPFKETAKLENISSGGAYFCLDSGVVVGSRVKLAIELPKELTEGRKVKLQVGGMTIRLEKPNTKRKKQGVAVRFSKEFRFVPGAK